MHERKALMAALADAFAALPGGYGTADETFEILTWAQLKLHAKPVGLLNVRSFFDPLLAWIDRAIAEGFIKARYRQLLHVERDVNAMVSALSGLLKQPVEKKKTSKWPAGTSRHLSSMRKIKAVPWRDRLT